MKLTLPDGRVVDAETVEVSEEKTPWSVITLEDGTILRMRFNITSVLRLDVHNPADGNPVYRVNNNLTIRVQAPKRLKARSMEIKKSGKEGIEVA